MHGNHGWQLPPWSEMHMQQFLHAFLTKPPYSKRVNFLSYMIRRRYIWIPSARAIYLSAGVRFIVPTAFLYLTRAFCFVHSVCVLVEHPEAPAQINEDYFDTWNMSPRYIFASSVRLAGCSILKKLAQLSVLFAGNLLGYGYYSGGCSSPTRIL